MRRDSYQVPENDGGVLIEPALEALPSVVAENHQQLGELSVEINGQDFQELRGSARSRIVGLAVGGSGHGIDVERPIVMTGHQAEFFHPGIWFKNFLAGHLAASVNGTGVNLVVDSDTSSITAIRFPQVIDGTVTERELTFLVGGLDLATGECVVGQHTDLSLVEEEAQNPELDPALRSALQQFLRRFKEFNGENLAIAVTRLRQTYEASHSLANAELLLGHMESEVEFSHFVVHMLQNHEALREAYNSSLAEYRDVYGIRSKANPLPDLEPTESPFWIWRAGEPREPLHLQHDGQSIGLTYQNRTVLELQTTQTAAQHAEAVTKLAGTGYRIRSRALTTTMFFRLFVSDLFIHGVGGGKYDIVTDTILERLFEIRPPKYAVSSATLHLPIEAVVAGADNIEKLRYQVRDLHHNPVRYVDTAVRESAGFQALLEEKEQLLKSMGNRSKDERFEGFLRTKSLNREMRDLDKRMQRRVEDRLSTADALRKQASILRGRSYPFFLFPESKIAQLLADSGLQVTG